MEREIKFRAWDVLNEAMEMNPYYFELYHYSDETRENQKSWRYYEDWRALEDERSRDCYIMQFTCKKDIKGTDVYDGDIVRVGNRWNGLVYFDTESLRWDIKGKTFYTHLATDDTIEIVGNIYANHDLIK